MDNYDPLKSETPENNQHENLSQNNQHHEHIHKETNNFHEQNENGDNHNNNSNHIPQNNENKTPNKNLRQNNIIYFIIISSIVALIVAYYIYNHLIKRNNINPINENQNKIEEESLNILKNELKRQNRLKYNFMKYLDFSRINEFYSEGEEIKKKINIWKNISYPYLGIERFAIPMISTISAGKSSTLNYLLNLKNNKLQIGEKITTKFCMIIRHNKYLKEGKIYNVIIEKRAEINKYNFHKGKEIKVDIKTFVEERNKLIVNLQKENKEIKDPNLYFVIMEIDTGLFDGEYEKYADLVEFIDIPGLNEIGVENNRYFRDVLPFIKMNFLFPIIILDAVKFDSSDVFKSFNEIFKPYLSNYIQKNLYDKKMQYDLENQNDSLYKIKTNSLFLINKLNLYKKNDRDKNIKKIIN